MWEAFALCHYLPAERPVGLRDSLRPPVGRSARAARTTSAENETEYAVVAAPRRKPGHAWQWPECGRPVAGGSRMIAAVTPCRAAGPTSDRMRSLRSARRRPSATTVTRPSRRRICRKPVMSLHAGGQARSGVGRSFGDAARRPRVVGRFAEGLHGRDRQRGGSIRQGRGEPDGPRRRERGIGDGGRAAFVRLGGRDARVLGGDGGCGFGDGAEGFGREDDRARRRRRFVGSGERGVASGGGNRAFSGGPGMAVRFRKAVSPGGRQGFDSGEGEGVMPSSADAGRRAVPCDVSRRRDRACKSGVFGGNRASRAEAEKGRRHFARRQRRRRDGHGDGRLGRGRSESAAALRKGRGCEA